MRSPQSTGKEMCIFTILITEHRSCKENTNKFVCELTVSVQSKENINKNEKQMENWDKYLQYAGKMVKILHV